MFPYFLIYQKFSKIRMIWLASFSGDFKLMYNVSIKKMYTLYTPYMYIVQAGMKFEVYKVKSPDINNSKLPQILN